jgi:hypothetical protein
LILFKYLYILKNNFHVKVDFQIFFSKKNIYIFLITEHNKKKKLSSYQVTKYNKK